VLAANLQLALGQRRGLLVVEAPGPVMVIEKVPIAVGPERSQASKVAVYPGFLFTFPSAAKPTHFGPVE